MTDEEKRNFLDKAAESMRKICRTAEWEKYHYYAETEDGQIETKLKDDAPDWLKEQSAAYLEYANNQGKYTLPDFK